MATIKRRNGRYYVDFYADGKRHRRCLGKIPYQRAQLIHKQYQDLEKFVKGLEPK